MELVLTIVLGVFISLVAMEFYSWEERISLWFARTAASLLPSGRRERYVTEWYGHLADTPKGLVRLANAISLFGVPIACARDDIFYITSIVIKLGPLNFFSMALKLRNLKKSITSNEILDQEIRNFEIPDEYEDCDCLDILYMHLGAVRNSRFWHPGDVIDTYFTWKVFRDDIHEALRQLASEEAPKS